MVSTDTKIPLALRRHPSIEYRKIPSGPMARDRLTLCEAFAMVGGMCDQKRTPSTRMASPFFAMIRRAVHGR